MVLGTIGVREAYRALQDIESVTFSPSQEYGQIVTEKFSTDAPNKNDYLVSQKSAELWNQGSPFQALFLFQGKMHGNICDSAVGRQLMSDGRIFPKRR